MEQSEEVEDVSKRRKRTSLRRWKARCWLLQPIPEQVIVEYNLKRWFHFAYDMNTCYGKMTSIIVHDIRACWRQMTKRRRRSYREVGQ